MYRYCTVYVLFLSGLFIVVKSAFPQPSYNYDPSVLRDPEGYKIRYGDRIRVIVRGEPECTSEETISNQGTLNIVYLGDIFLVGLNKQEAVLKITNEYTRNLIFARPKVSLSITKYSERVVFLTGSVNRKGPYVFPPEVEAMNIVEVIARAGGFNGIAKKNKVLVTRTFFDEKGMPTNTQTYEVDVEALSSGSTKSKKNFWVYPGDRIEVPERLL